ncbi:hypothetical protein CROQUDRAFT_94192 [Cronartium quercuum f. sp. fusiforme G11]|uniref:Uncharacterized protein n=1 Tax=Cronartium quercuum f. sp. fusiforme G11 TaxID=708437 RepID=A0A9P6TAH0_9BASI|nr:hypothetical protein CROQUDRAFT_94192 [Cronartium quercuum f. sp. fusiforme G11]
MNGKVQVLEEWWDDYIPGHLEVKPFHKEGLPNYDLIAEIMLPEGDQPTGANAKGTNSKQKHTNPSTKTSHIAQHALTPTELALDDEGSENKEANDMEEDCEAVVVEELNPFFGIPKVQPSSKPVVSGSGACLEVTDSDDSNLDIPITSCVKPSLKVHPIGPLVKTPHASGQPSMHTQGNPFLKTPIDVISDNEELCTPLPKHMCETGPKVLAQSVDSAVKQEKIHVQTEHSLAMVKKDIVLVKLDKFPNCKTAMALFNASSAVYFEDPLAHMVAAEVLFDEDKANQFVSHANDLRWLWLKKEIGE